KKKSGKKLAADGGIMGITGRGAAVEGLAVRWIERAAATETNRQIGIGKKENRKRDQVGATAPDDGIGARQIVALVAHESAAPDFAKETNVRHFAVSHQIARGGLDNAQRRKTAKVTLR